jgi:(R)-2-hydroxyacyl-CoA dehydratese activating ATPase
VVRIVFKFRVAVILNFPRKICLCSQNFYKFSKTGYAKNWFMKGWISLVTVGVDIGSLAAKAVLFDGEIRAAVVVPTGWQPKSAGETVFREVVSQAGYCPSDVSYVVGTGYGRVCLAFADEAVTEITCHARGAAYTVPGTQLVIDIGGQDSKVIRVGSRGNVEDFAMNDKCAAGTGRFLEVMAAALGMDVDEMGKIALDAEPASISSMCTVFAESEVVSLLAAGTGKESIVAGLHRAIGERVATLAGRMLPVEKITFTGGVAKNLGVRKSLEKVLGVPLQLPFNPQIIGALGAALVGQERLQRK